MLPFAESSPLSASSARGLGPDARALSSARHNERPLVTTSSLESPGNITSETACTSRVGTSIAPDGIERRPASLSGVL